MATLTVNTVTSAGLELVAALAAVAAGGDEFANDGNTYIEIRNSSGANAYTVNAATAGTYKGYPVEDEAISVGTNEHVVAGPFPTNVFNDANGLVQLTYTGSAPDTDLTIAVFKKGSV